MEREEMKGEGYRCPECKQFHDDMGLGWHVCQRIQEIGRRGMTKCVGCGKELSASEDLIVNGGRVCGSCYSECPPPPDPINPAYYLKGKIEVADFIADQKLDYFEGNVVKYICRWRDKGGVQDLHKIKWYVEKLIDQAVEGDG